MKIGILSESNHDTLIIKEIVLKIVTQINPNISADQISFYPYEVDTSILSKMKAAITSFFGGNAKVDFAVFGVDLDRETGRRVKVNQFINKQKKIDSDRVIYPLFSNPHIEELFFAEGGNAIKSVLTGLIHDQALPFSDLKPPKTRLKKLIKDFGPKELSTTAKELCQRIASKIDINHLAQNSKDFKKFKENFVLERSSGVNDN